MKHTASKADTFWLAASLSLSLFICTFGKTLQTVDFSEVNEAILLVFGIEHILENKAIITAVCLDYSVISQIKPLSHALFQRCSVIFKYILGISALCIWSKSRKWERIPSREFCDLPFCQPSLRKAPIRILRGARSLSPSRHKVHGLFRSIRKVS